MVAKAVRLAWVPALALVGCASVPKTVPVVGRSVKVQTDGEQPEVKGELLAVGADRLWVRAEDGVREVPLSAVRKIAVKRHGFGGRKAFTWAAIGGAVTGGALAAACGSVEGSDSCGTIGIGAAAIWLVVGGIVAPLAERSSTFQLSRPTREELRGFARLPQGLPEGLTPGSLSVAPSTQTESPRPSPSPTPTPPPPSP